MYIDSIRVYQSNDDNAHIGHKHTLGCDPPEYPTKDYIVGNEYRYMRNPPFSYLDKHPLRPVPKGGGECNSDKDCGSHIRHVNFTEVFLNDNNGKSNIECQKEIEQKCRQGDNHDHQDGNHQAHPICKLTDEAEHIRCDSQHKQGNRSA